MDQTRMMRVIASVTKLDQIKLVMKSRVNRVNLITGNIMNLHDLINQLHSADKQVYVHLEMVGGLGRDYPSIQNLATNFKVDGIISTKSNAISAARKAGLKSILRVFTIDTAAVDSASKLIKQQQPDEVELMPGLMPRIIGEVKSRVNQPLIVGGLVRYEQEIELALDNGADFVSTGDDRLWNYITK